MQAEDAIGFEGHAPTVTIQKIYDATFELRWLRDGASAHLQQLFKVRDGSGEEWRNVPMVAGTIAEIAARAKAAGGDA